MTPGSGSGAGAEGSEVHYLDVEDLLALVVALRAGPVRDLGLLEAAAARPRASLFGQDAYPSIDSKAAALLHSLVRGHPLVDGNKRIAWLAAVVFADLNGYGPALDDDAAFELVMAAAQGHVDVAEIAVALRLEPH